MADNCLQPRRPVRKSHDLAYTEKQCAEFNAKYPVGSAVTVHQDNGCDLPTATRSPAYTLGDGTPVVLLTGVSGCYALWRVTPAGT